MAAAAMIGLAAFSAVGSIAQGASAADAQHAALTQQLKQERLRTQQETINSLKAVTNVMSKQDAAGSVSGESLSSPSFNAIQLNTLKQFGEDQNANALNFNFQQQANAQEQQNVSAEEGENIFNQGLKITSTVAENDLADIGNKVPKLAHQRSLIPLDI